MLNRVAFAAIASAVIVAMPARAFAQVGPAELLVRIDRLENQIRQLTGEIEQMHYRNQQLEAALRRLQDDNGGSRAVTAPPGAAPPNQLATPGGRRSDAFDPMATPNAPGTPRSLGSIPPQPAPLMSRRSDGFDPMDNPNAPGTPRSLGSMPPQPAPLMARRSDAFDPTENPNAPGAPRALGSIPPQSAPMISPQTGLGVEPAPYGVAAGAGASAPPASPRDTLDLGMGYLQRRDYALAEETFRGFLARYPSDRLAADAQFGLGESLFQRQSYQEAANAFVALSKKYEASAKAPEALLRLGQSLAAMNERELACVAFGDVGRKYPRAQPTVKQAIEREQKRARC